MTISNLDFENSYTTDGVTNPYSFTFPATETDQVQVYLNGVLQNSGFIVALSLVTDGGTVTFTTPPATGRTLLIYRSSNLLQLDTLADNQPLPPATLEAMIDKLTIIAQQLQAQLNNAIVFPPTAGITFDANNTANWILGMDPTNEILEFLNPVTVFQNAFPNAGAGNVVAPVSAVVGNLPTFNSTNGQRLADSGTSLASILAAIAGLALALFGTANPNGVTTGSQGQMYYDTTNVVEYVCTAAGNNNWLRLSIPAGSQLIWSSTAAVPPGWVLCNGSNGTKNTIGLVIQGGDITGGSSTANAAGYVKIANQSTGGTTTNSGLVSGTVAGTTGSPSVGTASVIQGSDGLSGALVTTVGGSSFSSSLSNGVTSAIPTQPAVLSQPYIMKL